MAEAPPVASPSPSPSSADPGRGRVGVVVIGRNEGERLAQAVAAALEQAEAVVYVDSNSDDGSRERAAALGAAVVHLTAGPYTPSRGRQEGFEELRRRRPDLPYVQFIDGDCLLAPGWIATARAYLDAHPDVVAVFGRRREERTAESLYSRLMDVDWDHPPGEAPNFGGDALVRGDAVEAAGGWSAATINAEDIDLSFRVRAATGGRIVRLPDEMTRHDVRMSRFAQYWRRAVRAGYGYAEVGWRYRHGPGRMLLKRMASSFLYAAALPALAVAGLLLWWPLAALVGLVYLRTLAKLLARARARGADAGTAAVYAGLNLVCKAASTWGALLYLRDRLSGGPTRDNLIVYRSRVARTAPAPGPEA